MTSASPLLRVDSISKFFPGVVALDHVRLELHRGEILAVIGENGAGKSTLMKILAGIQSPDAGQVWMDDHPVKVASVHHAQSLGIALIHQEICLCQSLDIGANIFLGREPHRFGAIDHEKTQRQATDVLNLVGLEIPPETIVGQLTIGHQQMVEIAKAISADARIVIMDEPTSSLSHHETERLFRLIRGLQSRGVSIIYISHRLGEVELLADRVVVLRDGKNAGELSKAEMNHAAMVNLMVGRELSDRPVRPAPTNMEVVLEASRLRTDAYPECELDFKVHRSEIVGIAGLVGAGRTELLTTLFGVTPAIGGTIAIEGKPLDITNCRIAIEAKIGLVPEDRKAQGLILEMSVAENTSLAALRQSSQGGRIDFYREQQLAEQMRQRLRIKTPSLEQSVKLLSGGNQQKVVIGKWLALSPSLLLMDEPTRGVDVGAKQEIYQLMDELAQSGVAILFVSSDMEEVLAMSDRLIVMHEGRMAGELSRSQSSEQAVMNLATGGVDMKREEVQ